ncbi:MAG: putative membrane protein [Rhodothermales bacterium]|jgi:uncharacterized membrane protein
MTPSPEAGHPGLATRLTVLILAALVGISAFVFSNLPAEIPVHFGPGGAPDGFAATSWLSWMMLPLLAVAMSILLYGIGRLLARIPDQLNMPDPKLYLALPMAAKLQVVVLQQRILAEITVGLSLMFVALQLGSYQVALGVRPALPWYSMAAIVGFVIFTIVVSVRGMKQSGALVRALTVSEGP